MDRDDWKKKMLINRTLTHSWTVIRLVKIRIFGHWHLRIYSTPPSSSCRFQKHPPFYPCSYHTCTDLPSYFGKLFRLWENWPCASENIILQWLRQFSMFLGYMDTQRLAVSDINREHFDYITDLYQVWYTAILWSAEVRSTHGGPENSGLSVV